MSEQSPENIAWAAGLFEGEGSVYANTVRQGAYRQAHLALTMTDEQPVRRFAAIVGANVYGPFQPAAGRKQIWRASLTSHVGISVVFTLLRPWLSPRRIVQFERVLLECRPVYADLEDSEPCGRYTSPVPDQKGRAAHFRKGEQPCRMCRDSYKLWMQRYKERKV